MIATKKDYALPLTRMRATFPEPLPAYLPRTAEIPAVTPPVFDPNSANAGRFSLSLKGMRRELRRSGFRAELLVRDIESEIMEWLREGGTILSPDLGNETTFHFPGTAVRDTQTISEVSRTPLQLVWSIADDAFARYVVHCCARYHEIISFSEYSSIYDLLFPTSICITSHRQRDIRTTPYLPVTTQCDPSGLPCHCHLGHTSSYRYRAFLSIRYRFRHTFRP